MVLSRGHAARIAIRRNNSSEAMICSGVETRESANHVLAGDGFVRLVELEFRTRCPHIGPASGVFQVNSVSVALFIAREFIKRAQGLAVKPGLERKLLGLVLTIAEWPRRWLRQ